MIRVCPVLRALSPRSRSLEVSDVNRSWQDQYNCLKSYYEARRQAVPAEDSKGDVLGDEDVVSRRSIDCSKFKNYGSNRMRLADAGIL